ncbi:hypothetical protein O159_04900 [Leifsonia xyli subsp. cynodontis DSM 46306]|uniref:Uncharacterized protein n=1 Tax=Leifsonia xyli subsp. cynodontis DSM 46306 TaxID=1389489 RepID=U3P4J2_LEIXC|nr:hypothetical protein [Leifsonia xyli]AGW40686.1 hypothetical protein O159_04900 [Leifsonia xyli subsp. cynodontis DSM 46306]
MLTPPPPQKTGAELRQQLLDFTADALTATALPDGWRYGPLPDAEPWDPDTSEFTDLGCSTTDNNDKRQQFGLIIDHDPVGGAADFANIIADHWNSLGYPIEVVTPTMTNPGGNHYTGIATTLPNGAWLMVRASDYIFTLDLNTECSTDPTLNQFAGPHGYRDFDPLNPLGTPTPIPSPPDGRDP